MDSTLDRQPLGQLLISRGLLQPGNLDIALQEQRRCNHQKLLGEILIERQLCSDEQVIEALAQADGVPFARIHPGLADPKAVALLPVEFLRRKRVLPLFRVEGTLTVAVTDPTNLFLLEELEHRTGHRVQPVAATASDIRSTLDAWLPAEGAFIVDSAVDPLGEGKLKVIEASAIKAGAHSPVPEPAVVRLIDLCLYNAIKERATEIHVEPADADLRIRFRIDGRLIERFHPPRRLHGSILSRFKSLCAMEVAQHSLPQEGRLRVSVDDRPYTLRAATAPARAGEKLVLRISADEDRGPLKLEKLGFSYETLKQWRKLLALRSGLLLVTAPAGSGKRAVLYASLHERNAADANVCTVEDPIERALPGVNQFQIDSASGFNFPAALRAVLCQEPDTLMISDLADAETARLAAEAALGGKLVLAALNAQDGPSALWRLLHLGIDPHLLASALSGVLVRRLVRKLCPTCREPREAAAAERRLFDPAPPGPLTLFHPHGCDRCNRLGFSGRIGIHELLIADDLFRDRLSRDPALPELRDLFRQSTPKPLRADGLDKARAAVTTLEEVLRAQ